jgi:dipeptidyl aminopeptidase/acylaminoacyl peptidase
MERFRRGLPLSRRGFALAAGEYITAALAAQPQLHAAGGAGIRPAAGSTLETFADGSTGQVSEFPGCEGTMLPAFLRKPKGSGPFPVVVILHGGAQSIEATYGMARTRPPTSSFVAAGWAVVTIDYRPTKVPLRFPGGEIVFPPMPPIEVNDTLAAVEAVRRTPMLDAKRIAVMGGSHGGYVMSKVISRTSLRGGIICSPAIFDTIELGRALDRNVPMIQTIKNKIAEAEQKYGAPLETVAKHPEAYGYESPMTETAKVRCPVLIINGRNDTSSPPSVMEVWAEKLRVAGKEVETYMPENAPHGFYFASPKALHPETDEAASRAVAFVKKHFA